MITLPQLVELLYNVDPQSLNSPIRDEYKCEAKVIHKKMQERWYDDRVPLSKMIHKVFQEYFGEGTDLKGNRFIHHEMVPYDDVYLKIADKILEIK